MTEVRICKIISFMVPDGPISSLGYSQARTISRCEEHDWEFNGLASALCPIGRIEKATGEGLAKLAAATSVER